MKKYLLLSAFYTLPFLGLHQVQAEGYEEHIKELMNTRTWTEEQCTFVKKFACGHGDIEKATIEELRGFLYVLKSNSLPSVNSRENMNLSEEVFPLFRQNLPIKRLLTAAMEKGAAGERDEAAIILLVSASEKLFSNRDLITFFKIFNYSRLNLIAKDKVLLVLKIKEFVINLMNEVDQDNVMIFLKLSHLMNDLKPFSSRLDPTKQEMIKWTNKILDHRLTLGVIHHAQDFSGLSDLDKKYLLDILTKDPEKIVLSELDKKYLLDIRAENPEKIVFNPQEQVDEKAFFQAIHHLNGDHRLNKTLFDYINKKASLYFENKELDLLQMISSLVDKELLSCPKEDAAHHESPFASRILLEDLSDLAAHYIKKLSSPANGSDKQDPEKMREPDLLKEEKISKKNNNEE